MFLADGLIPFLLHLESYLLFEKLHKVEHCHQLRLLRVQLLLSKAGSMPQDDEKQFYFLILQAYHQLLRVKQGTGIRIE